MIPVKRAPEPLGFHASVREKGRAWLVAHALPLSGPLPPTSEPNEYWKNILDDLKNAYGDICAFAAVRMGPVLSCPTVEHFKPKSLYAEHIYEWDNYRLVCSTLNSIKRNFEDVLDPCEIAEGTFELDAALLIHPGATTVDPLRQRAEGTINRLKLNRPDRIALRAMYWTDYLTKDITARYLRRCSPFVAREMERLGLLDPTHEGYRP